MLVTKLWCGRNTVTTVTYLHLIHTVIRLSYGEFGLINVHLFDILPAISSRKVREKSVFFLSWEWVTLFVFQSNSAFHPYRLYAFSVCDMNSTAAVCGLWRYTVEVLYAFAFVWRQCWNWSRPVPSTVLAMWCTVCSPCQSGHSGPPSLTSTSHSRSTARLRCLSPSLYVISISFVHRHAICYFFPPFFCFVVKS